MSSGARPAETDAGHQGDPRSRTLAPLDRATDSDPEAGIAEAEQQAARAQARAEAARARATQLRRQAEAASGLSDTTDAAAEQASAKPVRSRRRWLRRPGFWALAVGACILLSVVSLSATGYMVHQHDADVHKQQRAAEFAAAAQRDTVILMSVDADKPQAAVQRIIDNSTGKFKDYMEGNSNGIVGGLAKAKVSSEVKVQAVAVESMTDDSAVVLVAAKSDITGSGDTKGDTKQDPRTWRLSVTLKRDGGQLKMSHVEFVQ